MRVAVLHNFYCQRGGEDAVFAAEAALLEHFGHGVHRFSVQNRDIDKCSLGSLVACAARSIYSPASGRELRRFLRQVGADLVHVHNFFPRLSPSAYWAARAEGLPVVQTLHNYRLLCAGATLHRDGRICEKCLGQPVPLAGVRHGCFQGSRAGSAAVAAMVGLHRMLRTWSDKVDVYIAPTEFARRKFVEGGLPAEKIAVKPHFVPTDPGPGEGRGGYVLFAGRLAQDKGIATMLAAWALLGGRIRLKIAGDGPQASLVKQAAASVPGVEWLGEKRHDEILELLGDAALLLVPSECYETFGLVVIEAYAKGTPVVASDLGAVAELVRPGRTGLLFQPGDAEDLAQTILRTLSSTEDLRRMRRHARREFEDRFQPEQNYRQLLRIYATARARARRLPYQRHARAAVLRLASGAPRPPEGEASRT